MKAAVTLAPLRVLRDEVTGAEETACCGGEQFVPFTMYCYGNQVKENDGRTV